MQVANLGQAVFTWVLERLADAGLVRGKTVGIDATMLEANAALRSTVHRDTGAGYETLLRGLTEASGIPTPTRAELARFDRKRRCPEPRHRIDRLRRARRANVVLHTAVATGEARRADLVEQPLRRPPGEVLET